MITLIQLSWSSCTYKLSSGSRCSDEQRPVTRLLKTNKPERNTTKPRMKPINKLTMMGEEAVQY